MPHNNLISSPHKLWEIRLNVQDKHSRYIIFPISRILSRSWRGSSAIMRILHKYMTLYDYEQNSSSS